MQYVAFVQRDEPIGYRATLPDFPGCSARATSWLQIEDAIRMAVRLHVETIERIPSPTPIELLSEDSAPPNSCWMLVTLFVHEVCPPEHPAAPLRAASPVDAPRSRGLLGSRARASTSPHV
jgi:predicted RNase H-like HicB family nuclease